MMHQQLLDRVVFLTGGAKGIGRESALAFAREGALVAIVDRELEAAQATAAEIGTRAMALECDVGDGSSVTRAVAAVMAAWGRLDVVHNNAGIAMPAKPLHETTDDEWDTVFRINLKSVHHTTRAAFPHLVATRGTIVNTASMVGLIGQDNHAAYASTKGGMIALTKAMAVDYAPYGIRVNAVCPASVWTPMLREWLAELPDPAAMERTMNEMHLLGYCPDGDVIADAVVFLASDRARFITGCILPVSGGAELGYRRS